MTIVLVVNSGSSSLKYQLVNPDNAEVFAHGLVDKIGENTSKVTHSSGGHTVQQEGRIASHAAALQEIFKLLAGSGIELSAVQAVGHRVVNGGPEYSRPTRVTPEVIKGINAVRELAPLHTPANLNGIEQCLSLLPHIPQVAVFDTGFFADLPQVSYTYAIDRALAQKLHIRRYGFHGTSHDYVSHEAATLVNKPYNELNQIVLHLGNGASVSAIKAGKPIDTSMGLTPLEGLVMGTRSGDIDPAIISYISHCTNDSLENITEMLNKKSGLLGLTGTNDVREVYQKSQSGDELATLALAIYVHRIRKYVGAYWLELGTVDVISFTAGVGENAAWLRESVCAGLSQWGLELDPELNNARQKGDRIISRNDSTVTVCAIATNEELMIARAAAKFI